jgi:hypothetical protein
MKYYLILVNFFIVLVRPVEMQLENSDVTCNTPECQQSLQNRLETIEAAIRTIVTTLSSQTGELFPVKEIFAQDPAISSILSATPMIRSNFTTNSSTMKNETTAPKGISIRQYKTMSSVFISKLDSIITQETRKVSNKERSWSTTSKD